MSKVYIVIIKGLDRKKCEWLSVSFNSFDKIKDISYLV